MNKLNYAEIKSLGYDAKEKHEEELLNKQIAKQQPVINTIKDLETERYQINQKAEETFQALLEVFQEKLTNMDNRGINECTTEIDIEKIKIWNEVIVFNMTSTASSWRAKIQISKNQQTHSSKKVFDSHIVMVEYNALCPDAVLDANAFTEQVQKIDFQVFMDDLNKCVKDSRERVSIINAQGSALVNKIEKDNSRDRGEIMSHLISEVTTNGLTRPAGVSRRHYDGKFIVTERLNSEDGYYMPWKLKVVDSRVWKYQNDDTELACEVTFRKSVWSGDGDSNDYYTQHVLMDIPKHEIEKWLRDLFIYQLQGYSPSAYGDDYNERALEMLRCTPYLNISEPAKEGHYRLNNNRKERALRDSFGEWVKEAKTEKVKA
jgi:hypothetical protein